MVLPEKNMTIVSSQKFDHCSSLHRKPKSASLLMMSLLSCALASPSYSSQFCNNKSLLVTFLSFFFYGFTTKQKQSEQDSARRDISIQFVRIALFNIHLVFKWLLFLLLPLLLHFEVIDFSITFSLVAAQFFNFKVKILEQKRRASAKACF